jgi:hypothetical protein
MNRIKGYVDNFSNQSPRGVRMEGDAAYFSRRASDERLAASNAVSPSAREAHMEMAERYDELAAAISSPASRGPRLVSG